MEKPSKIKSLCVYCGSSLGVDPLYAQAAVQLGVALGNRGLRLVYGGSNIGLMGKVSSACRDAGGDVIGIIPERIAGMVPIQEGIRMEVVADMHARKARMAQLSDGFVALPGGIGTLEEVFEAWTWTQLGYHSKPVALYDIDGYWETLETFLDSVVERGFLKRPHRDSLVTASNPQDLLVKLESWSPSTVPKV